MAKGFYAMLAQAPSGSRIVNAFNQGRARRQQADMLKLQEQRAKIDLEREKQQLEQGRYDAERQQLLPEARASYQQGRPQMLQQLAPEEAQGLAEQQAKAADAAAQRSAQVKRYVAQGLQAGKLKPEQAQQILQKYGGEPDLGPFGNAPSVDPTQLEAAATARLGAQAGPKQLQPTGDLATFLQVSGMRVGDPGLKEAYNRWRIQGKKAGATQVSIGDASRKTRADQEAELITAMETSGSLDELQRMATPQGANAPDWGQFLGGRQQAGAWLINKADKWIPSAVSSENREQASRINDFRAVLDKYRAEEYKRLLGSAQSEAEIKNLVNAIISGDMSPAQFDSAFQALRKATARSERIAREVLGKGFDLGSPGYRREFSRQERAERAGEQRGGASDGSVGARRTVNGETRVWDGSQWVRE